MLKGLSTFSAYLQRYDLGSWRINMKLWQGRFEEESDPVFEKMNRSLGIDAVLLEVDIRASRAPARSLLGFGRQ